MFGFGKITFFLFASKCYAIEACDRMEVWLHTFLTLRPDGASGQLHSQAVLSIRKKSNEWD
jgi:hypothetical protein